MATYAQRASSLVGAILNGTPTNAQVNRVGVALASRSGNLDYYNTLTDAAKAQWLVSNVRDLFIAMVRDYDVQVAAAAAQSSAATDLPETP